MKAIASSSQSAPQARPTSGDDAWWKRSVVYQIYPRSFQDSDGDGIGDLRGITSRLDHLATLGVDVVWLSPVYQSPQDDNGYDISDYRAIHPEYGTMADFDAMLVAMHARGLKLMMDLVVNHTSDEHPWFVQARSARDNPFHGYYIWAEPADGGPPNNWDSVFGGSAWEWNEATGEYFLHMFSMRQPDLNWENPALRAEVHALMRFWLDKGVDGFRMDVINMISKPWTPDGRLPDAPVTRAGFLQSGFEQVVNGPRLKEFLLEMKEQVLRHHDCITVGEAPFANTQVALDITDAQTGALNMLFQFDHVGLDTEPGQPKWKFRPLDLRDLKRSLSQWQLELADRGWNSLYLNNHDQPRAVSRYADDGRYRIESAKMLALLIHGMKGTPYVYQGEEIGMTNFPFESIDQCRDIETLNMVREAVTEQGRPMAEAMRAVRSKGRDNARTPMQWDDSPQAGFTQGAPWLAVHPNFASVNVRADRAHAESVFDFYRRLIALRRERPELVHGRYALVLAEHPEVFAYTRTLGSHRLLVACNFSANAVAVDWPGELGVANATMVLGNLAQRPAPWIGSSMRPYEAWLLELANSAA